jgi:hypothetical protein
MMPWWGWVLIVVAIMVFLILLIQFKIITPNTIIFDLAETYGAAAGRVPEAA